MTGYNDPRNQTPFARTDWGRIRNNTEIGYPSTDFTVIHVNHPGY